jgi:uncharacterized membrane protein YuzA (DUF378 family)
LLGGVFGRRSTRSISAVTLFILILGGLSWGYVALADTDLVASLLGEGQFLTRLVYGLFGIAALVQIGPWLQQLARDDGRDPTQIRRPDL